MLGVFYSDSFSSFVVVRIDPTSGSVDSASGVDWSTSGSNLLAVYDVHEKNGYLRIAGYSTDFKVSGSETNFASKAAFVSRWFADGTDSLGSCNSLTSHTAAF